MARPIRVLHCPAMVGGNAQELARAERAMGLDSVSVALYPSAIGYEADEIISLERLGIFRYEIKRWKLFLRALSDFDVIHFNFGRSILPHWISMTSAEQKKYSAASRLGYRIYSKLFELADLPVLKRAKKGIVVTYQGNDARQGDYCKNHFAVHPADEDQAGYYVKTWDEHRRTNISTFSKYADRIFALNPDLLHILPEGSRFLPYSNVDLTSWTFSPKPVSEKPVILHAPSLQSAKGTRFILDAVGKLKREGVSFEFMLVENMRRNEARRFYERADLLIDQLLIGWYGGVAVEMMALGKPVIAYIRQDDLRFIPSGMRKDLPIIEASPDTIYNVLKEWLTDNKNLLQAKGKVSRLFVETWHDPVKIAAIMKSEYESILKSK